MFYTRSCNPKTKRSPVKAVNRLTVSSQGALASTVTRGLGGVVAACFVLGLTGCATPASRNPQGNQAATSEPAVATPTMTEFLGLAQVAESTDGGRERARSIYVEAAKAYPTDKRPWLRLSQSYFDAADYGNAINAAKEAAQRDPADSSAQGLLAVSGLRVSTAALSALRSRNGINTSTRSEAEEMAKNLRAILKEPVLVPRSSNAGQAETRASTKTKATSTTKTVAATSNPFGALK